MGLEPNRPRVTPLVAALLVVLAIGPSPAGADDGLVNVTRTLDPGTGGVADLELIDRNLDGRDDMYVLLGTHTNDAAGDPVSAEVGVLTNDGSGAFSSPDTRPALKDQGDLEVRMFDAPDPAQDFARHFATVSDLFYNEGGRISVGSDLTPGSLTSFALGLNVGDLVVEDLLPDAGDEILAASSYEGGPDFAATLSLVPQTAPNSGLFAAPITSTVTGYQSIGGLAAGNIDAGDPDVEVVARASDTIDANPYLLVFEVMDAYPNPGDFGKYEIENAIPLPDGAAGSRDGLQLADVNSDGYLDVVMTGSTEHDLTLPYDGPEFVVLLGQGGLNFGTPIEYDGGLPANDYYSTTALEVVDFNLDGKLDVVFGGYDPSAEEGVVAVARGNNDGTFQPATKLFDSWPFPQIEISDLDGDNLMDVVSQPAGDDGFEKVFIFYGKKVPANPPVTPPGQKADPLSFSLDAKKKLSAAKLKATATCNVPCRLSAKARGKAGRSFGSRRVEEALTAGTPTKIAFAVAPKRLKKIEGEKGSATIEASATSEDGQTAAASAKVKLKP